MLNGVIYLNTCSTAGQRDEINEKIPCVEIFISVFFLYYRSYSFEPPVSFLIDESKYQLAEIPVTLTFPPAVFKLLLLLVCFSETFFNLTPFIISKWFTGKIKNKKIAKDKKKLFKVIWRMWEKKVEKKKTLIGVFSWFFQGSGISLLPQIAGHNYCHRSLTIKFLTHEHQSA